MRAAHPLCRSAAACAGAAVLSRGEAWVKMSDTLHIHELAVECRVGVFDWERAKPQTVWMDLTMAIDAAKAAASDELSATVDYARLVTIVTQHVRQKPFGLLETMAEEVAALILKEFQTSTVTVRLKKRALPGVDYAAVEVTRFRGRRRVAGRPSASSRLS
ncbi:MAG: dihydroneopterin aldolase [Candidatus Omnitrophota bacterium]|nr:dihydroneopterin aldolase [Candidatus Omnitrophota bacterium]